MDAYPRGTFAGKVKMLPRRPASDVKDAVEMLNSGAVECREDFAVFFSEPARSYMLMYKVGKYQEALGGLAMSHRSCLG